MRDALQGGSLAEAELVAGISDRAAGAKDVLGEVSFIEVIEAGQGGIALAFVGKGVLGSIQLRDQRAGLESHLISTTHLLGDLGQTESLKPTISS